MAGISIQIKNETGGFADKIGAMAAYLATAPDDCPICKSIADHGEIAVNVDFEVTTEKVDGCIVLSVFPLGRFAEIMRQFEGMAS